MKDYADIAHRYARDVLEQRIAACKWVRLACQRHERDLARQGDADFPYVFNPELVDLKGKTYRPAQRICGFAELMPHIKGDWAAAGMLIALEPWQVFFLVSVFGWIHPQTGKRRFWKADLFVPRKNAKSTIASIIGLYMLAFDGEHGAEVYSGATTRDQAHEVFRPARLMAVANERFRATFGVIPNISNLAVVDTNSKFEPVIGKPGDGASPSCAIVDEYHEHSTSELYDTMWTGMGARSQPLQLMITTAGSDIGGPCFHHQAELQKMLEGVNAVDERRFGLIYTIDAGDDWTAPAILYKANPNLGVSIDAEKLIADQAEAVRDPRKQAVFKTKHLDIWVNAASPWMNLEQLGLMADRTLTREQFKSQECWIGLDLASKSDIASAAWLFRREIDGEMHYYLFTRNWLPQAAVERPENQHYQEWVIKGDLVQTPGNMINLRQILEEVQASATQHLVHEVAMDAWGSREIAPVLQEDGFTVIDVPQNVRYLSEPMKAIAALVDAGRFHHDGNEATTWMFSNVGVKPDRNDNIFPRKDGDRPEKKIDAALAAILAMGRAMLGEPAKPKYQLFFA